VIIRSQTDKIDKEQVTNNKYFGTRVVYRVMYRVMSYALRNPKRYYIRSRKIHVCQIHILMKTLSKYHIIRFIIETAYEDHRLNRDKDKDWDAWFHRVVKMFKGKLPKALLKGLASKSPELYALCSKIDVYDKDEQYKAKVAMHKSDRDAWIQRRDEGNRRVAEARAHACELKKRAEMEASRALDEAKCREMQPTWDKMLEDIVRKRDRGYPI